MKGLFLAATALAAGLASPARGEALHESARLLSAAPSPVIIGLGESAHDDPVSLAWRNELTLTLVRQDLVRLVLLEIGYAESRLLDAYVKGRGPLTPETVDQGFTNGLGMFAENRALIESLRTINQSRPPADRVGVAGIDLSAGGPWGSAPGMAPVDCALEGVSGGTRAILRDAFLESVGPGLMGAPVTPEHVRAYGRLVTRLQAAFPKSAPFAQGVCLRIVAQGARLMATLPAGLPGAGIPRDAWRNIEARDQAMAETALLLAGQTHGRPVVVLSHLSHIAKTPMRGPRWARLARSPRSMGYFLAARLGRGYRTLIEVPPPDRSTCPAAPQGPLLVAADAPGRTCAFLINRSDTQIIDLRHSADLIRVVPRRP